jgi:hypothetical protein
VPGGSAGGDVVDRQRVQAPHLRVGGRAHQVPDDGRRAGGRVLAAQRGLDEVPQAFAAPAVEPQLGAAAEQPPPERSDPVQGGGALRKGSTIEIGRRDGSTAVFTVDAVEVYAARNFPDDKVYGAAPRPELRVITCGGGYSKSTGYQGNVVVFAHLTASR